MYWNDIWISRNLHVFFEISVEIYSHYIEGDDEAAPHVVVLLILDSILSLRLLK